MARHRRQDDLTDIPAEVIAYDPEIHGTRDAGIRQWKALALSWLDRNPGRRLPVGTVGDATDVLREAVRLLQDEWFGGQHRD